MCDKASSTGSLVIRLTAMTVYSFYIFDRHTECVYSKSWLAPSQTAIPPPLPPHPTVAIADDPAPTDNRNSSHNRPGTAATTMTTTTTATAAAATATTTTTGRSHYTPGPQAHHAISKATRAQNDAKLIFGTVFSLRNIVRKLGGDDDAFISYRTGQYRMHYYETPANLRFVMLTDTATMSMRNVLHQIYINLWVEYVVKNPLAPVEHKGGAGVKNELFELGLDQFIRGLQ